MSQTQENRNFLNQFQEMQAAQKQGGVARALAFARAISGKTVLLTGMVLAAQMFAPAGSKPSDIIGGFHGSTESAEMKAKQDAAVQYERELANAKTAPGANWQMETQLSQTQQQAIADFLQTQSTAANIADGACMASGLVTMFFGDTKDNRELAQGLKESCGEGDKIRQNMTDTLARSVRNGSAVMQRTTPLPAPGAAPQR